MATDVGISRLEPRPERRSLVDEAYARLRQRILDEELPPGRQILEQELTLALGMSRTPVREALIRLEREGLVAFVPRRGIRITELSAQDVREINELLGSLETTAAERLAARRPGAAEMMQLEGAIRDMDRALEADDLDAWAEADYRFHCLLVELCGNRHLRDVARLYLDRAHRFRRRTTRLRAKPVYSTVNHAAVVEAIRRGDPQTAVEIHRAHKRRWTRELGELIERMPELAP
jgi:DNA-binding GntR family transcriptional regulator